MVSKNELVEAIRAWLVEREIPFLVQQGVVGFVHADAQVSVFVGADGGRAHLIVAAVTLTAFKCVGLTVEDLEQRLRSESEALSPVVLALGQPTPTIWACVGWELDEFDPGEFVEAVEDAASSALALGPELRAYLGSGVLGADARFRDPEAERAANELKVSRRRANHIAFEHGVERLLGLPFGSVEVTFNPRGLPG